MPRVMTSGRAAIAKERAARFVRDVLGDESHAAQIDAEQVDSWADRKGIRIKNPFSGKRNGRFRPMPTKLELERRVAELEDELEGYEDRENQVLELFGVDGEDDGSAEDEDEDED